MNSTNHKFYYEYEQQALGESGTLRYFISLFQLFDISLVPLIAILQAKYDSNQRAESEDVEENEGVVIEGIKEKIIKIFL